MGSVVLSDNTENKLTDLVNILFYKRYFGYKDSAKEYVQRIRDFIETIPTSHQNYAKTHILANNMLGMMWQKVKCNTL